jgi:hypothetical protein
MDISNLSRRAFLATTAAAAANAQETNDFTPIRSLVETADLIYEKPIPRSEEGIPIGNGRMGSLVWTTPSQLKFQINRPDVYASDSASNSFFERHNDYCGGCGFVDIDFGEEVFPETGFRQHLRVYDGLLEIKDISISAHPDHDVFAIRIPRRQTLAVSLRMLRYETKYFGKDLETLARDHANRFQTRSHTAESRLEVRDGRIVLIQVFREGDYCCKSAVAIGIFNTPSNATFANDMEVRLTARPGAADVFIASAASFDVDEDIGAVALRHLDAAAAKGSATLARETADWWHDFWRRGHISLPQSPLIQQNYYYFLYVLAATSRGKFPPKFNGLLFNTGGDLRTWGAQHWYANLSCYYEAVYASNRLELLNPVFTMYQGMYEACATAARQQWGSQGIYIPETCYFNGLEKLPEDIASEMRELYLMRKPWQQRSAQFMDYAQTKHPHSSRWNWIGGGAWKDGRWVITERGFGPYGAVNHILATTAKIAYYFWRFYEFTRDEVFLRNRAYPMLKGAVEFYRNYPNLKSGPDGRLHIQGVNSNESVYGARDSDEDMSAMRGVTAALLAAARILNADLDMQPAWASFLEQLAPLPASDNTDALKPDDYAGPRIFVRGLKPAVKSGGLIPDGNSLPMFLFDLCNSGEMREIANATFDAAFPRGIGSGANVTVLSKLPIAGAMLGRADTVRYLIPAQIEVKTPERNTAYKSGGVLANRMTLREGPQALDAQRLGRAAEALHLALLQSNPRAPGENPVIKVFPAWPTEQDASFRLLARGGFMISSSFKAGHVEFVEIESLAGGECVLVNPWNDSRGEFLRYHTNKRQRIRALPVKTAS